MALRMCSAHATSTSADGKQEATVFALSHSQGETRLWYAIETINPATRLRFIALDIVREEAREVSIHFVCTFERGGGEDARRRR